MTIHQWPSCPVCGALRVNPVYRKRMSAEQPLASDVLAYRCENGHVFMPPGVAKAATPQSR